MLTKFEIDEMRKAGPFSDEELREFEDFQSYPFVSTSQQAASIRFLETIKALRERVNGHGWIAPENLPPRMFEGSKHSDECEGAFYPNRNGKCFVICVAYCFDIQEWRSVSAMDRKLNPNIFMVGWKPKSAPPPVPEGYELLVPKLPPPPSLS